MASKLQNFNGDLAWIHAREGHGGSPYWPGGASGVTLDPGFDVGHAKPSLFESAYADVLTAPEMETVRKVIGIQGDSAKAALKSTDGLTAIKISRSQADEVFPVVATPYWEAISKRYPTLIDAPGSVQTALLSIAFNRGANNRRLSVLDVDMEGKRWLRVADVIGNMQQDHKLEGISKRRRMESDLISAELDDNIADKETSLAFDLDTVAGRQRGLDTLGYPVGSADGIWGKNSAKALRMFQEEQGLVPDGLWGKNSKRRMTAVLAAG